MEPSIQNRHANSRAKKLVSRQQEASQRWKTGRKKCFSAPLSYRMTRVHCVCPTIELRNEFQTQENKSTRTPRGKHFSSSCQNVCGANLGSITQQVLVIRLSKRVARRKSFICQDFNIFKQAISPKRPPHLSYIRSTKTKFTKVQTIQAFSASQAGINASSRVRWCTERRPLPQPPPSQLQPSYIPTCCPVGSCSQLNPSFSASRNQTIKVTGRRLSSRRLP